MKTENAVIFIMPRSSKSWRGAEALWITVAGWAVAAQHFFGNSVVATSDGIYKPDEVLYFPLRTNNDKKGARSWHRIIPEFIITAYKDWKLYHTKPHIWPIENTLQSYQGHIKFVWEQHDLFPGPGRRIADTIKVPLVLYVHAPVVWEMNKWGTKRPLWGKLLEKYVESSSLKKADLVACVSEEVRQKVIKMGVRPEKTLLSPMSVDGYLFNSSVSANEIRQKYNLVDKIVIGWTGSFRSFHGLDNVVNSFHSILQKYPTAQLLLVGDGFQKSKIENLVHSLKIEKSVIFAGKQSIIDIPKYIAAFDIALVSAKSADSFHYFPLKLKEYLAMGKPTIAPRAGDIPDFFTDGDDILLYNPADNIDLSKKIELLIESASLRNKLSVSSQKNIQSNGLWLHQINRVLGKLNISF